MRRRNGDEMLDTAFEWSSLKALRIGIILKTENVVSGQCTVCHNDICSTKRSWSERGFEKREGCEIGESSHMVAKAHIERHALYLTLHGNTPWEFLPYPNKRG